jgi:hypothetical protein
MQTKTVQTVKEATMSPFFALLLFFVCAGVGFVSKTLLKLE